MKEGRAYLVMTSTFILAWILMIAPFPFGYQWLRPEWLSLMIIYWIFTTRYHVNVIIAGLLGLAMDVLGGTILGQYALSMALVAYLAHTLRHRVRLFPLWQQTMVVLLLVGISKLSLVMIQWIIGQPPRSPLYWVSILSSCLLWPWINGFLKAYERKVLS